MRTHVLLIAVVSCILTASGCGRAVGRFAGNITNQVVAQPSSTVELLESELRWMEDNLYHMDDQLDRCLAELESARRDNATLRRELVEARQRQGDAPSGAESVNGGFDEETELADGDLFDLTKPPNVELGAPSRQLDPADDENGSDADEDDDVQLEGLPEPNRLPDTEVEPGDPSTTPPDNPFQSDEPTGEDEVSRIQLNRKLTGGYDFDNERGDDGVLVVLEPQNAFAQYVAAPGDVTIEVMDPARTGLQARVAKWKFDAPEVATRIKQTLLGRGIHFELPWPGQPPQNEALKLVVTYRSAGGRSFRVEQAMTVDLQTSVLVSQAEQAERSWYSGRPTPAVAEPLQWRPTR